MKYRIKEYLLEWGNDRLDDKVKLQFIGVKLLLCGHSIGVGEKDVVHLLPMISNQNYLIQGT
jgi:hypothetical protein